MIATTNRRTGITVSTVDPVLKIYRRYRALEDEQEPISDRSSAIRAALIERWGEPSRLMRADDIWGQDPALAELRRLNDKCDMLTGKILAATERMNDTPATTIPGVMAKLQLALDVWPGCEDGNGIHEHTAISAIRDAMRVLQGTVA
jgi:hypothetical protein